MTSISPLSDPLPSPTTQQAPAAAAPASAPAKPKSKPRKRVNTAEKRHQHNAIERARRETLNSKFLSLARLLPSLANHRRPSKSAIVNGSISHISNQREQRLLAASLLKQLSRERDELYEEVNEWRKASGVAPKEGPVNAWNDDMDAVCSVEHEVFGNFASMDGDDDGEDEPEYDMASESKPMMPHFAVPSVNGLITPRPSTDVDPMNHPALFQRPPPPQVPHQMNGQPQAQQPTVNMHGVNWSQEFASQFHQHASSTTNPTPSMSNNTPLPFSAFMSDSTDSPGTSNLGNSIMLTPPTTADSIHAGPNGIYTHTPSPRPSNASVEDKVPSATTNVQPPQTQQWTPQQLLFLQQIQQHQAQIRQHQQSLANHYSAFPGNALNANNAQAANPVEGFTQSLIATMFPQQAHVNNPIPDMGMGMGMNHLANGAGLEQVQQWRKAALTSFLQQNGGAGAPHLPPQFRTTSPYQASAPMLTPGGLGMGMNGHGWSPENAVEGF